MNWTDNLLSWSPFGAIFLVQYKLDLEYHEQHKVQIDIIQNIITLCLET